MTNWEKLQSVTPNGSQTLSKMPNRFVEGVYPTILQSGKGCKVWDEEDKEYVDLIAGLGAVSVGYANEPINEAIRLQLEKGISFSLPTILEYEAAKALNKAVGFTEQWKFLKTGTEACMAAVKAARAITERDRIMVCGYHGWADWYAVINNRKAGIPEFNQRLVTKAIYNKLDSFHDILSKKYACLIMEPMVFDMPEPHFLQTLVDWCKVSGTLLIFDEVVTGGRTSGFVAANKFGVEPDFIVLSKSLANGLPLSAIGGKQALMSVFERDDFFVSGTFGGECVSLAACVKTVEILDNSINGMISQGLTIKNYFNKLFGRYPNTLCKGYSTRLTFDFPSREHKALFMQEMCLNGVLVGYSNMVMADTTDEDIKKILNAIRITNSVMTDNWENPLGAIRGSLPVETLRLRN